MYQISKRFDFSASHQLEGLSEGHQCSRLHGHNYSVTFFLFSEELNEVGFIKDYGELDFIKKFIDEHIEHRHLNEVLQFNPTAEKIAHWFFDMFQYQIPQLYAVSVKETSKTEAVYSPNKFMLVNL